MVSRVYRICQAYESGFGHGLQRDGHNNAGGKDFADPEEGEAYCIGYKEGEAKAIEAELLKEEGKALMNSEPETLAMPEPDAYLFDCSKPGMHMQYASVGDMAESRQGPNDWWKSVTRTNLYSTPPYAWLYLTTEDIEGFLEKCGIAAEDVVAEYLLTSIQNKCKTTALLHMAD